MSESKLYNIVILPFNRTEGMAGSIRIRNLFKPVYDKSNFSLFNIIFSHESNKDYKSNIDNNTYYLKYSIRNPFSLISFWKQGQMLLSQLYNKNSINVLYIYNGIDILSYYLVTYAKKIGYKIVIDVVEDYSLLKGEFSNLPGKIKTLSSQYIQVKGIKYVDQFIAISEYLKTKLEAEIGEREVPVIFIPTTVDFEEFYLPENDTNANKRIKLFYGGSFGGKDGLIIFLKAIKILILKGYNIELSISGSGNSIQMGKYRKAVNTLNLDHVIAYKGFVNRNEYVSLLKRADIHCMTRIDSPYANAGFPFKLAEMLATGKPVISSKLKSITQLLNDEEVAFVKPGDENELSDAMIKIIMNTEFAGRLGENGKKACEKLFSCSKFNILQSLDKI